MNPRLQHHTHGPLAECLMHYAHKTGNTSKLSSGCTLFEDQCNLAVLSVNLSPFSPSFSYVLCAGEYDHRPGRQRDVGGESRQERVHRPADQDADHRRRQKNHTYRDAQPPLRHNDTFAGLPAQRTVSRAIYTPTAPYLHMESVEWFYDVHH